VLIEARIVIGEYSLEPSNREGMLWMMHESGEGMEIEEAKLAETLKQFYSDNF